MYGKKAHLRRGLLNQSHEIFLLKDFIGSV